MEELRNELKQVQAEMPKYSWQNEEHREILLELQQKESDLMSQIRRGEQGQQIDGFLDTVQQIFSAMFPKETYSKILGLTEYEEKQQDFHKLTTASFAEKQEVTNEKHEQELAEFEKKLSESRQHLNDALERNGQLVIDCNDAIEARDELEKQLRAVMETLFKKEEEIKRLSGDVQSLTEKLERAQKPADTYKPSQSLNEMIENVRIKSIKELSPDDMLARFNARQQNGSKMVFGLPQMELPNVDQVQPFRPNGELDQGSLESSTDPQEALEQAKEAAFQSEEESHDNQRSGLSSDITIEVDEEEKTLEERVRALEVAVFGRKVNENE